MNIVFGGSFNPPTIAHYEIIKYLYHRYDHATIVLLPNATIYPRKELASNVHRLAMLELLIEEFRDRTTISTIEMEKVTFEGTYYTLKLFEDPYFVIGTDNLQDLPTWIQYQDLVKDNHFLVLKRRGYDFNEMINQNSYLRQYQSHFIYLSDFNEVNASSSSFRQNKDFSLVNQKIKEYINEHQLY
ncbi:MAG TPA: nicotinate (nicotinamide) nucleotide adenylyltransferase [Bacilli bacterium]|nr:nicotinate (nicotinamide) nucleotide adenylyltransferase [Bacilli bacterium]